MILEYPKLRGLVLSGGKSSRMGRDKGAIPYHGITQRAYLYNMLKPLCEEVFISCRKEQIPDAGELPCIEDALDGAGPMIGILSAFEKDSKSAWLTVACDLPFLTAETLAFLIRGRNPSKMATAFFNPETQFPEPLITIWEPSAYPVMLGFLNKGYTCPRKVLINSDIQILDIPDIKELQNINHAYEYDIVMRSL